VEIKGGFYAIISLMKILKFPENFYWGTSISSHQTEGNNKNNWSEWEKSEKRIKELKKQGKNPDNFISGLACNHYHLYEQDFDLVKELNNNALRFSIEWSRIEPRRGIFNQKEINHYKEVLLALKQRNIEPFVTIWHFTTPIWFEKLKGWNNKKAPEYFSFYVKKIVEEFGSLVNFWITINEPLIYAFLSYHQGIWPPQEKNLIKTIKVIRNLIKAHKLAYKIIKRTSFDLKKHPAAIGIAKNNVYFEAYKNKPINIILKKLSDYFWNKYFLNKIKNHLDFIGLNYYAHNRIKFSWEKPNEWWKWWNKNENKNISDIGWEIYPKGIYYVLLQLKKYNKPIYITENGIADRKDEKRSKFIVNHLKWIHKAIKDSTDVRGYFYWSLMDNFEWALGFYPRFGLYKVDYRTQKRTPRPSSKIYAEICKENSVTH